MIIDAHATDTVPSHEVRQRTLEALANAGEPMSEVTYDALRKRIAELESKLQEAKSLLLQAHDTIFRLHDNSDVAARNLITKIRFGFSGTAGGKDE